MRSATDDGATSRSLSRCHGQSLDIPVLLIRHWTLVQVEACVAIGGQEYWEKMCFTAMEEWRGSQMLRLDLYDAGAWSPCSTDCDGRATTAVRYWEWPPSILMPEACSREDRMLHMTVPIFRTYRP